MSKLLRALLDPANLLSLAGLGLGAGSMLAAIAGRSTLAPVLLIWAGAADLLDGKLARAWPNLPDVRELGRQLDSLVDACSFGACPVVLLHVQGRLRAPWEVALLLLYLAAVVLRLARFNLTGLIERDRRLYWQGVPTTYMALLVPALLLLAERLGGPAGWWALRGGLPLLALGMISTAPVPRPRAGTYLALLAAAILLSAAWLHQS